MIRRCLVSDIEFEIPPAELEYCQTNYIPLPTLSPHERLRNMLVFRNRVHLYNAECALSGKKMLSSIPPERGYQAADVDAWESDSWDARDYGRDYDFSRSFFEQFYELYRAVPIPALANIRSLMENSDYTNGITGAKNCYLLFASSHNEDCLFSCSLWSSKNIADSLYVYESELCYGCVNIRNCYNLRYSEHCHNCRDSAFLSNCQSCSNCYRSANLSHKQFCFENHQLTKEEYFARINGIDLGSNAEVEEETAKFARFVSRFPIKFAFGKSNQHSTGNFLNNNKNAKQSYFISNSEDVFGCLYLDKAKTSILHAAYGNGSELIYNCVTAGDNVYNLRFCVECWQGSHDLEYCINCCYGSANSFGCVGLKKMSHCILNKEYSKEEYFILLERIRNQMRDSGEYGQFFPPALSPYYYNQSAVQDFFPIDRKEALEWGFRWKDDEPGDPKDSNPIPDNIRDVSDEILTRTLVCEKTAKPYKLIPQELALYRRHGVPIPRRAPLERIREKLTFFKLAPLQSAACAKCGAAFETVYSKQTRPVYCETCFQQELF